MEESLDARIVETLWISMKIATWNVNSLNARLPRVLEFLDLHAPDLLLMQETKVDPDKFPDLAFAEAGYHVVHHSAGRWAGVAIAAPTATEFTDVRAGLEGEPDSGEARWLEATAGSLRVITTYVPNGRAVDTPFYEGKLRFLDAAAERVRALAGGDLVLAGDFNVCPTDLDVYDPAAFVGSTHVTGPERERFQALLDAGMVDAFRELHPDEPGFTWWDYRAGHFHKKLGLRIDAILLSKPMAPRLETAGIDRNFRKGPKPSDHAPLIADLNAT
jgi:exodeoxyribonuclease-3